MMKESKSSTSKMINKNWVLKRKRRKLPFGQDRSIGKEQPRGKQNSVTSETSRNTTAKRLLKTEAATDQISSKKKGNDGCIPMGKWQCPSCSQGNDTLREINHLDSISKRTRTKIVTEKSKGGVKPLNVDKVSQIFGGTFISKKRSSSKGKSISMLGDKYLGKKPLSSLVDATCSSKPTDPTLGISMEETSTCADADEEKTKEVLFPIKTELEKNNEQLEVSPDLSDNKMPSRKPLVLAIAADGEEMRKQKLKVNDSTSQKKRTVNDSTSQKKRKTEKGKVTVSTSMKCKSQYDKVHKKKKPVTHSISASLSKEDAGTKKSDVLQENEVDRVLGCRIQGESTNSSRPLSVIVMDDSPCADLLISENQSRLPESNSACNNDVDVKTTENLTDGYQNVVKSSDKEESLENINSVERVFVYRRSMSTDNIKGNPTDSLSKSTDDSCSPAVDGKDQDHSSVTAEHLERTNDKMETQEDMNVTLRSEDNNKFPKTWVRPVSPETKLKEVDAETGMSSTIDNNVQNTNVVESSCLNADKVLYEFLVKWVGKSNIHNSWISESKLKVLAKRKLENYKAKYGMTVINICEEQWKQPQRVLALRTSKDGTSEAFVKWTGLPYDECTWESLVEPVLRNSPHLINLFDKFETLTLERDASQGSSTKKINNNQTDFVNLIEQPKELKGGSLFPHQLEALNWLRQCWYKSKNVILADEMGLGKTISACAFISSLYFEFKVALPSLVLVPLSTMPNWLAEFALWAPDLNVVEYHGCAKARAINRQYEWHASDPSGLNKKTTAYKFNVLLTTYEMVLADSSHLHGVPWEVLVVDEGHRLKNSGSKLFSLLNTFSFQHRVLLTGTPLQNNIGEMYNLLNFLQPASFPSLSSFEEKFNDLTTAEKVDELKKLVAPHMLRRLKKDAMKNIPPKIERMVPVELSSIQAEYYRAMLTKNYQILRNIGKGVAQQSMLNIVMQLRKVCNHPYLIPGTEPDFGSVEFLHEMRIKASAKLTLLHSMLKVLHKEGHRVLIFSQMTKLLDILEDYLSIEFGPKTYERVDGSVCVADRQAAIARFNQDTSRFVFLLSTRACGLGINLATADTVIIYDSDFNPHADIQAMNRAHRIGQSNRLLVYRLVVRASVEERILQLAKKKLMLDQLFVNKSESQKEVEDILKWGTEELFNDSPGLNRKDIGENNSNKDDTVADIEHKHRKRSGSLGDVYKDKCTDSSSKIVWDENAISKLLDRSNLQHGSTDVTEGDPENDMLGSVKSLEWNDEPTEEQGVDVSPTHGTNDICAQNSERKEDNAVTGTEENEWDRLLRVRWEKYQSEEEAALGRGKRQRKAVTYREAYAPHRSETMSECGGEEEKAPEPEPEREYTAAGRALKAKFVKLRARQKERLAQRNAVGGFLPAQGLLRPESLSHSPANAKDEDMAAGPMNPAQEGTSINSEDNKMSRFSKHRKSSQHDDSVSNIGGSLPDVFLPNHHNNDLNTTNSIPTSNSLPILGLCAPNANQIESSESNPLKTSRRRSRQGMRQGFPFSLPSCSGFSMETEVRSREAAAEIFQQSFKDSIPDHNLPFVPFPPAVQGKEFDAFENARATISAFQEKTLPNLPFDERLMARFPLSTKNMPSSHLDLLPNLSLGGRLEALNRSMQDLPTISSLPNFKMPPSEDLFRFNQQHRDVSPSFDLGQRLNTLPSFPENQRKVLENILMRTGSTSSNLFRKKPKLDGWSEDELDSLWVGVRRHGRGNWDVILRDPKLKFSKYKMPEDLSVRWEEEQLKVFQGTQMTKSTKSALFPISDGMMERALHGSRFILPPKFKTHLTDMKLGIGDPPSDRPSCQNDHFMPQSWSYDKYRSTFPECASAEASDRPGTSSNAPTERPFLPNSFGASFLGSFGLNHSSSTDMHDSCIDLRNGDCISRVLSVRTKGPDLLHSKGKDIVASSTSKDKLPHWLREAVSSPAKLPDPDLPPTISAISQSIRLLHGDDKPTIPPFVVPGPPPSLPKDPRHSLKKIKRRRSHKFNRILTDVAGSTKNIHMNLNVDYGASSSRISGFQQIESDPKLNSLKLEAINPSHSSSVHQPKNTSTELPPSPEVLQLGESCVAPDPHFPSISSTSSFLESKLPMTKPVDQANFNVDCEGSFGNKVEHSDSGDSSKTQSDPSRVERHDEAEISSEGTVSDHAERDQET